MILLCLAISTHVPPGEDDLPSAFPEISTSYVFLVFFSSFATISAQDPLGETDLLGSFSETSSTSIGEIVVGDWALLPSIPSSLF